MDRPKRILVVKNRALGDAIIGLGTLQYLREIFPQAHLCYALPKWIVPLFSHVKTDVDEVVGLQLTTPKGWGDFWKFCQEEKFDIIYELHQKGSSEKFLKAFSMLSRTPYFFHNHNLEQERAPAIQRDLQTIAYSQGNKIDPKLYLKYQPQIQCQESEKKYDIILGVVATRLTKVWPLESFFELTELLKKNFPSVKIGIPVSSSSFDQNIKEELTKLGIAKNADFIEEDLAQLPGVLSPASLYLGNDTGLKHLCVALGMRSLTFFGPEEPFEWHPYDLKKHPVLFKENLYCRVEKSHFCSLSHCESMACLKAFSASAVMEVIKKENLY